MSRLSVEQAAALLATDELPTDTLEALKCDPRLSIIRLLEKRERRLAAAVRERRRLEVLHHYELDFHNKGFGLIAGVDEAGRGPLAGPVVVAAVILPQECRLTGIDDSKKLSARQREKLYESIRSAAVAVNHAVIGVDEIDRCNIYQATLQGMYQTLASLCPCPDAALIDAMPLSSLKIPYLSLIGGDALSASIAAASIIAKVERDRIMDELDAIYPQYGFARHKGYATSEHLAVLKKQGPCPVHRKSFSPVKSWGALFHEDY